MGTLAHSAVLSVAEGCCPDRGDRWQQNGAGATSSPKAGVWGAKRAVSVQLLAVSGTVPGAVMLLRCFLTQPIHGIITYCWRPNATSPRGTTWSQCQPRPDEAIREQDTKKAVFPSLFFKKSGNSLEAVVYGGCQPLGWTLLEGRSTNPSSSFQCHPMC